MLGHLLNCTCETLQNGDTIQSVDSVQIGDAAELRHLLAKSQELTTQIIRSDIVLSYSPIQRLFLHSEIYSVPVVLHILPTLVKLQRDDQLNSAV